MPNPLGYSIIEEFNTNENKVKKTSNSIDSKKKTRKNRSSIMNKKVENFLASLDDNSNHVSIEDKKYANNNNNTITDFNNDYDNHMRSLNNNPYAKPVSVYNEKINEQENQQNMMDDTENDNIITQEDFNTLQNQSQQDYYNSYVPYTTNVSNQQETNNQGMLIEKLNYMIHLLEEQQEEKTGHVTEELILYSFLGVFVIFVIDSFARASKYVR